MQAVSIKMSYSSNIGEEGRGEGGHGKCWGSRRVYNSYVLYVWTYLNVDTHAARGAWYI